VWHLFSCVIYLAIDEQTLRARLGLRTSNDFGKASKDLEAILSWHKGAEADCLRRGLRSSMQHFPCTTLSTRFSKLLFESQRGRVPNTVLSGRCRDIR
jgi:hypothetical protein